jgi:CheY-like chemotaxis protein
MTDPRAARTSAPHIRYKLARMARPQILLVGGNPPVAAMLTDYFHHDDRYEIESVEYGDDALALLQRRRFDLVLVLSLHVPWTMRPSSYSAAWRIDFANAILLLKHLRGAHGPPPVILISGSLLPEAKEEALANGAFAFLPKPVDLAELDRFVELALESQKGKR